MWELLGVQNLGLFVASGLLLNLTPGADTVFVVTRSVAGGRALGVLSAIGISSGSVVHCLLVAFGVSGVLFAEPVLFKAVQWAGIAWLGFIALNAWRSADSVVPESGEICSIAYRVAYLQAVLTNLLNPKVGLFFLALLPQFVTPEAAMHPTPYLVLGGIFILSGTLVSVGQAVLAASLSATLRNPRRWRLTQRISAGWLAALTLWLAWQAIAT